MIQIGITARRVRERLGLTQRAAADLLGVSAVHLSNVERGRTAPSSSLVARFRAVYKIDVYVLTYCLEVGSDDAPLGLRTARLLLAEAMQQALGGPPPRRGEAWDRRRENNNATLGGGPKGSGGIFSGGDFLRLSALIFNNLLLGVVNNETVKE